MDGIEKLYYSLGQLAYVIAKADGIIQNEEKQKLHDLVINSTKDHEIDFNYSEIIFWLLEKENQDSKTVFKIAMSNIHSLKHFFNSDLREKFLLVLQQIADAYPPATIEEEECMEKIKKEFASL